MFSCFFVFKKKQIPNALRIFTNSLLGNAGHAPIMEDIFLCLVAVRTHSQTKQVMTSHGTNKWIFFNKRKTGNKACPFNFKYWL